MVQGWRGDRPRRRAAADQRDARGRGGVLVRGRQQRGGGPERPRHCHGRYPAITVTIYPHHHTCVGGVPPSVPRPHGHHPPQQLLPRRLPHLQRGVPARGAQLQVSAAIILCSYCIQNTQVAVQQLPGQLPDPQRQVDDELHELRRDGRGRGRGGGGALLGQQRGGDTI